MNLKETLRYLGYKGSEADERTLALVESCWRELEQKAERRSCFREFPLILNGDGVDAGCFRTESRDLGRNLGGCGRVVLFAATLGIQADNLIRRYSHVQMSRAVVMQAASAAMLEDYCDQVNEEIRREYERKGMALRPRFSPGYGDFPLACQPGLIGGLEAEKRIGLTLTDSLLMVPSKSVTAVIGVCVAGVSDMPKAEDRPPVRRPMFTEAGGMPPARGPAFTEAGCAVCGKTDCIYRREKV